MNHILLLEQILPV